LEHPNCFKWYIVGIATSGVCFMFY